MQLPEHLSKKVRRFPEVYLGVWRVRIVLADGRTYPSVEVAWSGDIIRVPGHRSIPFGVHDIADVHDDSGLTD